MSFASSSEVGSLLDGLLTCEDRREAMGGGGGTALVERTTRDLTVDAELDLT